MMEVALKLMAIIALIPQVLAVLFFLVCVALIAVHVISERKKTISKSSSLEIKLPVFSDFLNKRK